MLRLRALVLFAAGLAVCGCVDNSGDDPLSREGPAQQWGGVSDLCAQWQTVDVELAAEAANARAEVGLLAELLPEEYRSDAALFYYPGAGDPGPGADGVQAEEAGERLARFRLEECGPPP